MSAMTLEPITWAEGDEYNDPEVFRQGERYWWHQAIATELERLKGCTGDPRFPEGIHAYPIAGIAGNIGQSVIDVAEWCRQMVTWGELVKAEPLWDFEPELWVALAADGE